MSPPAEDLSGLHPLPIDPDAAEALLAGTTPPGFEQLSAWLSAARPAPAGPDDPLEQLAVGALTGAAAPRAGAGGGRLAPRLLTAKTVAIAIATTIALGGTSAAAATGTLPSPVQSALARSLRHLGLTLPDTAATRNPTGAGAHPLPTHTSTSGTSGTADPALTRPDRSASSPARGRPAAARAGPPGRRPPPTAPPPPETPPAQVGHRAPDHHGSRPDELGGHRDLSRPRPAGHR